MHDTVTAANAVRVLRAALLEPMAAPALGNVEAAMLSRVGWARAFDCHAIARPDHNGACSAPGTNVLWFVDVPSAVVQPHTTMRVGCGWSFSEHGANVAAAGALGSVALSGESPPLPPGYVRVPVAGCTNSVAFDPPLPGSAPVRMTGSALRAAEFGALVRRSSLRSGRLAPEDADVLVDDPGRTGRDTARWLVPGRPRASTSRL